MHSETKKLTHKKNTPYLTLTLTENLKLQLSPDLVASYDIQPGNGVGLFWDKHTHIYLLTYLPRTHTGQFTPMRDLVFTTTDIIRWRSVLREVLVVVWQRRSLVVPAQLVPVLVLFPLPGHLRRPCVYAIPATNADIDKTIKQSARALMRCKHWEGPNSLIYVNFQ